MGICHIAQQIVRKKRQKARITRQLQLLMLLIAAVHHYNSCRRRSYVSRAAVVPHSLSPWAHLYERGDHLSFLNLTGFSRVAFEELAKVAFPPADVGYKKRGRPCVMSNKGKVGLVLYFLGSQMGYKHLAQLFGVVSTTVGEILRDMIPLKSSQAAYHPVLMQHLYKRIGM